MSGYNALMRAASGVLFAITVIVLIGGIVVNLGMIDAIPDHLEDRETFDVMQKLALAVRALDAAAWPFFGAALLWRLDRAFPLAKAGEAAE